MIRKGSICILDQFNYLNLKEYQPCKVQVIKSMGFMSDKFLVRCIEPVVFPTREDSYAMQEFVVDRKYLTESSLDEKIVIRYPCNLPKVSEIDLKSLDHIINIMQNGGNIREGDIKRMKALLAKLSMLMQIE